MSSQPRLLLEALNQRPDIYASGMVLVRRSESRISRSALYVHLSSLEDAGLVRSRHQQDDRRLVYQITSAGIAALLRDDL